MKAIAEQLPGGGYQGGGRVPSVKQYILLVLNNLVPPAKQGRRNREELLSLAASIDTLTQEGGSAAASSQSSSYDQAKAATADHLMQRFKMLEAAVLDGNWEIANSMSLVDQERRGLTTQAERETSLRDTMKQAKFIEARDKVAAATKKLRKDQDR